MRRHAGKRAARLLGVIVALLVSTEACNIGFGDDFFGDFPGDEGIGGRDGGTCEGRPEAECHSGCWPFFGYAIDEANLCFDQNQSEYFGCHALTCASYEVTGRDESGAAWRFPGGCVPFYWQDEGRSTHVPCGIPATGGSVGTGGVGTGGVGAGGSGVAGFGGFGGER